MLDDPDFGLDGVWSGLTHSLMTTYSTDKIELNKWWALTPQNWKCPSCERTKRQIARLNSSGIVLAKLVSHHDHIKEYIREFEREIERSGGTFAFQKQLREHLEKLAHGFFTCFEPTIVCEDCNNIEPEIRKALGLPSYLSLTPLEIGLFRPTVGGVPTAEMQFEADRLQKWCQLAHELVRLSILNFCADIHSRSVSHTYRASVPLLTKDSQIGSDVRVCADEKDRTDIDQ